MRADTTLKYSWLMGFNGTCISDSAGKLLFYSTYYTRHGDQGIYDHDGQLSIIYGAADHAACAIECPGRPDNYYFIGSDGGSYAMRIYMNDAEPKLVHPIPSDTNFLGYFFAARCDTANYHEYTSAIARHANGRDYWWYRPTWRFLNRMNSYLISPAIADTVERRGFHLIIQPNHGTRRSSFDTIRPPGWSYPGLRDTIPWYRTYSSPNSEKLCIASTHSLLLYRINRSTGRLYDSLLVQIPNSSRAAAFSPNSNLLYAVSSDTLFQLDLSVWNGAAIRASRIPIAIMPACPSPDGCETPYATLSDMKVAVNGKMYLHISKWRPRLSGQPGLDRDWPKHLSVLHCPDQRGTACGYEYDGQTLFGRRATTLLPVHDQSQVADAYRLQLLAEKRRLCAGDTTTVHAFGAGAERFAWSIASGPSGYQSQASLLADTGSQARFFSRLGGLYTLHVTGQSRCSSKDTTITVLVQPAITARAIADTLFCPPAIGLTGQVRLSTLTAQAGIEYRWQPLSVSQGNADTAGRLLADTALLQARFSFPIPNPLADTIGTSYAYSFTATDTSTGCQVQDTARLRIGPNVAAYSTVADKSACQGNGLTLGIGQGSTAYIRTYRYRWQTGSGSPAPPIIGSDTLSTLALAFADTASDRDIAYTLIRTVSAGGCVASDTALATAHPLPPRFTLTGPHFVCPGSEAVPYQLTAQTSSQPGPWRYRAGLTGGDFAVIIHGIGPPESASVTITVRWQGLPTNDASLWPAIISPFGCERQGAVFPVSVTRRLHPRFTLTDGVNTNLCVDASRILTYTAQDTLAFRSYAWHFAGGVPDTIAGTGANSGANAATSFAQPGTHAITLYETERTPEASCAGDTSLVIRLYAVPGAPSIAGPDTLCVGVGYRLPLNGDTSQSGPAQWTGLQSSGTIFASLDGNMITVTGTKADSPASVSLRLTSNHNCVGPATTKALYVRSLPVPQIVGPALPLSEATIKEPLPFSALGRSRSQFAWEVEGGSLLTGQGTSQVSVQLSKDALRYAVSVQETDANGCAGSAVSLALQYDSALAVLALPNIITPNGDGKNEVFTTPNLRFYPGARLEVYDRWGRSVYSQDNYLAQFTGQGLQAGTYLYRLSHPSFGSKKGWVEVVR